MSELNVGIVGAGIRGKLLGSALRQNPGVNIVAVAEPNSSLRTLAANHFQCPTFDDATAMLESVPSINTVLICTPDFAHTDITLAVARRGLTFLVEKPLTMNGIEADAIVNTASEHGAKGMVAFENRWNPVFKQLKSDIKKGDIGQVQHQLSCLNDTLFVPTQMLSWASRTTPGWFLMPHSLDVSLWLVDRTPVEVMAVGSRGICEARNVDTWDAISALITLDDGTTITLESNWILPVGMPQVFDFNHRVIGSDGVFDVSVSEPGFKRYTSKYEGVGVAHREENGRIVGMIDDMMRNFAAFARGEETDVPDLRRGVLITKAIEGIHASLISGAPARVM